MRRVYRPTSWVSRRDHPRLLFWFLAIMGLFVAWLVGYWYGASGCEGAWKERVRGTAWYKEFEQGRERTTP